jgi:hypothetical protein
MAPPQSRVQEALPPQVADLVEMARHNVLEVVGVEPDLTPETLPLVDHYLRDLPEESPPEVRGLVVSAVGSHFGEVVRRILDGRWAIGGEDPTSWRIELSSCFLYFCPVGMAGEVLLGQESDDYDGTFGTLDELWEGLNTALATAAPMSEEEYFSLAGRVDILHFAADWLAAKRLASGKPPRHYSARDYARYLEAKRT